MYCPICDNTKLTGINSTDLLFLIEPENEISTFSKEPGYLTIKLIKI